jgi:hypothetical protein
MNEQINGGRHTADVEQLRVISPAKYQNIVEEQLISRVTRFLDETSHYHSTET